MTLERQNKDVQGEEKSVILKQSDLSTRVEQLTLRQGMTPPNLHLEKLQLEGEAGKLVLQSHGGLRGGGGDRQAAEAGK